VRGSSLLRVVALLIAVAALSGCGLTIRRSYTVDQLQASVASHFPKQLRRSVFFVRLAHPQLTLPPGGRVALQLDLEAGAVLPAWRGRAVVAGRLEYRAADGGLYLRDPTVDRLELDGVPTEWQSRARDLTETAMIAALGDVPIYVLDAARHPRERAHLQRVWVEGERLIVELKL
jgi:hypothetical protein